MLPDINYLHYTNISSKNSLLWNLFCKFYCYNISTIYITTQIFKTQPWNYIQEETNPFYVSHLFIYLLDFKGPR